MTIAKRRARRIAADEAHAWARNLRLGNHHAKNVLRSLTLYVDGDGYCFVGIEQLADDCELSADTVRRRLVWLEEIGAVSRQSQWIDERGVRNSDARGKRTSDLIRLLFEADEDLIEARAAGRFVEPENAVQSTQFSPSSQLGLNHGAEAASPAPALCQPSHCGEGLISEPEPESPPKPSSGGPAGDAGAGQESEAGEAVELFGQFKIGYPDASRWPWAVVWPVFAAMAPADQRLAAAASAEYGKAIAAIKPRAAAVRPDKFLRQRIFDNYPNARLPERPAAAADQATLRRMEGDELAGLKVAVRMAEGHELRAARDERGEFVGSRKPELQRDLVALAPYVGTVDRSAWQFVERGSPEFAAWRDRLEFWTGRQPPVDRLWLEPHDPAVHGLPPSHPKFRIRKASYGMRVPHPWPPRKSDGQWPTEQQSEVTGGEHDGGRAD